MPISAWILTPHQTLDTTLLETLASRSDEILLGEPQGKRLPLVFDTPSLQEESQLVAWVLSMPNVALLDLVYVEFSDVPSSDCNHARLLKKKRNRVSHPSPQKR